MGVSVKVAGPTIHNRAHSPTLADQTNSFCLHRNHQSRFCAISDLPETSSPWRCPLANDRTSGARALRRPHSTRANTVPGSRFVFAAGPHLHTIVRQIHRRTPIQQVNNHGGDWACFSCRAATLMSFGPSSCSNVHVSCASTKVFVLKMQSRVGDHSPPCARHSIVSASLPPARQRTPVWRKQEGSTIVPSMALYPRPRSEVGRIQLSS